MVRHQEPAVPTLFKHIGLNHPEAQGLVVLGAPLHVRRAARPCDSRSGVDLHLTSPRHLKIRPEGEGPRFISQVRHRLCPGSPWEKSIATSRLRTVVA